MNNPISFQQGMISEYFNLQPSQVKGRANIAVERHKRYLYNKLYSVYKFTLPKYWSINWFRFWLFRYGSIGIVYSKKYGWVDQPYSIVKLDMEYNPKEILVYNTFITTEIYGLVGYNANIIHLMDDYYGLDDVVTHYAELLAQVDRSVNVNLMNSNFTLLGRADNKKQAEAIKQAYTEASTGLPLVVVNKDVITSEDLISLIPSVRNNFIAPDLMEVRRAIINAYLTEVGIRNVSVQKKERLVASETSENNDETSAIANVIFDNLSAEFELTRKITGWDKSVLDVKLRYEYDDNVSRETLDRQGGGTVD